MTIAAIQTRYAGCHFRSRLEARWAVLFDRLGIKWEYEPQGFLVGHDRTPYLPDFWLPTEGLWVEVKGDSGSLDLKMTVDAAIPHFGLPADPYGGTFRDSSRVGPRLLLLGSIPRVNGRMAHSVLSFWKGDVYRHWGEFTSYGIDVREPYRADLVGNDACDYFPPDPDLLAVAYMDGLSLDDVGDAYVAARSARFEHGESG